MGLDPGGAVEMMRNGQILLTFWLRHHMGAQGQNQVFICQQSVCSQSAKGCEASQAQDPGWMGVTLPAVAGCRLCVPEFS